MRVERVLTQLNQLIWGQGMTVLLILNALYFVCFARRYPLMRVKRRSSGDQKSKDAFFTALAGTLGIGGMVGVAAALANFASKGGMDVEGCLLYTSELPTSQEV